MRLSEAIRDYRKRTNISQRDFSRKCDLSNTYISFLENEKNPKTGRPLIPTLEQYKKIADGMEISVQELFELLDDDAPVDIRFVISRNDDPADPQVVINNLEQFSHLLQYMTREEYDFVIEAFDNAYKRMKEKGVSL